MKVRVMTQTTKVVQWDIADQGRIERAIMDSMMPDGKYTSYSLDLLLIAVANIIYAVHEAIDSEDLLQCWRALDGCMLKMRDRKLSIHLSLAQESEVPCQES